MRKIVLCLICLAMLPFVCAAQSDIVVKGFVRAEKGGPIPGAIVSAVEAEVQTKTDSDGLFTIKVPENVTQLQVASPGYFKLVLKVDGNFMVFNMKIDKGYASKVYEFASIEAKLARDSERRYIDAEAARIKNERNERRKEIDAAYNKQYKNIGFVHSLELSYGYQLAKADVIYKNLGYRYYGSLHPVEVNYTFAYRFNNFVSVGIGAGLQYQTVNLCRYDDVFLPEYQDAEDFIPINVPVFLNTKVYMSRGKFQPLLSVSGGLYLPNTEGMFEFGVGANWRISRTANMYFLLSCRTTPYGEFREYSGQEGLESRPASYIYYPKSAWTPSFKIGFTL